MYSDITVSIKQLSDLIIFPLLYIYGADLVYISTVSSVCLTLFET